MAIKNISKFVPAENEIVIKEDNYNDYLTNCYLDTTKSKEDTYNMRLYISMTLLLIVIVLIILTILNKKKL